MWKAYDYPADLSVGRRDKLTGRPIWSFLSAGNLSLEIRNSQVFLNISKQRLDQSCP